MDPQKPNEPTDPEASGLSQPNPPIRPTDMSAQPQQDVVSYSPTPASPIRDETSPALGSTTFSSSSPQPSVAGPVVSSSFDADTSQSDAPVAAAQASMPPATPPAKRGKRRLLLVIAAVVLLLGLAAGYVFGYYLPNTPENVWKSAITNTGKGYDALTTYASTFNKDVNGVDMQGTFKLKGAMVADGAVTGKSHGDDAQISGTISASGLKLEYEVRSIKSTGDTPDYYIRVNGLGGLGSLLGGGSNPELEAALNGINNQWYVIDHTLFEQLASAGSDDTNTSMSTKDVENLLNAIKGSNNTYLFTTDTTKAVFVQKEFVGAEERDGRSVYHYKAAVNQANFKLYLKALCGDMQKDKLGKLLLEDGLSAAKCDDFAKKANVVDTKQTADVWVDRGTKLVHAVRFTDSKQPASFLEIGQDYQGGSSYPFMLTLQEKDGDTTQTAKVKATLNTDSNTLKVTGTIESKGADTSTGSIDFSFKPNTDASFKVETPKDAKNIMQLVDDLGLGGLLGGS